MSRRVLLILAALAIAGAFWGGVGLGYGLNELRYYLQEWRETEPAPPPPPPAPYMGDQA